MKYIKYIYISYKYICIIYTEREKKITNKTAKILKVRYQFKNALQR